MQVNISFIDFVNFIMLIFHYLSNDDDTGTEFGNDGEAQTKNSDKKY